MPKYLVSVTRVATQTRTVVVDAADEASVGKYAHRVFDCANNLEPWFTEDHTAKECAVIEVTEDDADLRV